MEHGDFVYLVRIKNIISHHLCCYIFFVKVMVNLVLLTSDNKVMVVALPLFFKPLRETKIKLKNRGKNYSV